MSDTKVHLNTLLGETRKTVDAVVAASIAERKDHAVVKNALTLVDDAVDEGVRKACDQDLGELLVKGWRLANELHGYADPVKYPPERIVRVALADHTMKITIDPDLSLSIAGLPIHQIKLFIEFDAHVLSAVLIIQAGAITAFEAGTIRLAAKLRWGNVEMPVKLKTPELTIPGRIRLSKPVSLK